MGAAGLLLLTRLHRLYPPLQHYSMSQRGLGSCLPCLALPGHPLLPTQGLQPHPILATVGFLQW